MTINMTYAPVFGVSRLYYHNEPRHKATVPTVSDCLHNYVLLW